MQTVSPISSSSSLVLDILPRQQQCSHHSDAPFPSKLYEMLQYVEQNGLSHLVSWLPHGRSFKIHNNKKFMSDVANLFFRATKLRSIHRQLNLWGFKRVATGTERDSWQHPHFLRDQPAEMCHMARTKVKGVARRPSREDKRSPIPSFEPSLRIQQVSPDRKRQPESLISGFEQKDFDRIFMDDGEKQIPKVGLPFLQPRRVSLSSPSIECVMSSGNSIAAPTQANPMPCPTVKLARRDRYQGNQDSSNWMMAGLDPLMIEPVDLGTSGSDVFNADPSDVDEFSLFIGRMIQDP